MNKILRSSSVLLGAIVFSMAIFRHQILFAAPDWASCASDLDDVHSESDDAADASRDVEEAQDDLETKRGDLESCSPDCETERDEYEEAKSDLQAKIDSLQNELSDLDDKITSASQSCEYTLGSAIGSGAKPHASHARNPCSIYQRYKSRLPLASILTVCEKSMSAVDCKKCLGITN